MHGLINRALQGFVIETFGRGTWTRIAREAHLPTDSFEPMLSYDPTWTSRLVDAAAIVLDRPRAAVLEDMGTHLVSNPTMDPLRRLMRFGGATFRDFLDSLEDLPGRAQLALPDLILPEITLREEAPAEFLLTCRFLVPGSAFLLIGLLRAMADDYGALVVLDHQGIDDRGEHLSIRLLDDRHGVARQFDLAPLPGAMSAAPVR